MSLSSTPLALFNGSYLGDRPTGIGVVSRELVNELNPELVALLDPLGGSRPGTICIPRGLTPDYGRKGHIRRLIWTQTEIPNLLRKSGADFLLSPLPEAPILKGIRSIVLAHDLIPIRYPRISPLLLYHLTYVPLVLHSSTRVLCNSEVTAREIHDIIGIPRNKLITIPLGVNIDQNFPLNLPRENFFLVLGRHDPHKNLSMILRAFSLLLDEEIKLKLVGPEDKRYTPNLKALAKELGIYDRCHWITWVSDEEKLNLLNKCQALVIASLWEGFGLPALEAMACDTPVIASNAGALPEVIADAGLIVNPRSSEAIADAMKNILLDTKLREQLVLMGRKRVKIYNWQKSAKQVESIIQEI